MRITSKIIKVFFSHVIILHIHVTHLYYCIAGHGNLANHAKNKHYDEVKIKIAEALRAPIKGSMGNWVTVTWLSNQLSEKILSEKSNQLSNL